MIREKQIRKLIEEKIEGTGLFVTGLVIKPGNVIRVFLDSEKEVTIDNCVSVSRHIESNLDRETEDFELQVSSAGADQPLTDIRQYRKNVGRGIRLVLADDEKVEGKLTGADDSSVILLPYAPKKGKSKKKEPAVKVGENRKISYDQIKEAKVIIAFK